MADRPGHIPDNALTGLCTAGPGDRPAVAEDTPSQVTSDVARYPPVKNEALSNARCRPQPRIPDPVAAGASRRARDEQGFQPVNSGHIALDVVNSAPSPGAPPDATNYLGGIADVLEDKPARGNLTIDLSRTPDTDVHNEPSACVDARLAVVGRRGQARLGDDCVACASIAGLGARIKRAGWKPN